MTLRVVMKSQEFTKLRSHLLGDPKGDERAAFLLASPSNDKATLAVVGLELPQASDLEESSSGYLELRDEVLESLIVRAHALGSALIEAHSHPFDRSTSTRFSWIDTRGLREVAPQLIWRLPGRPYGALVFGERSFDSLYWNTRSTTPAGLIEIKAGRRTHHPTGLSLRDWEERDGSL